MKLFSLSILIFSYFNYFSQNNSTFCSTHKKLNELLKNKNFSAEFWENRKNIISKLNFVDSNNINRSTIYTIPVVFHVLHNGGEENISKEQILDALEVLNRDYRKLNIDINTVNPIFQNITADIEIEFKLATITPDGQCFNGITRTQSELSFSDDGWGQVYAIKNGNDVYQGEWPGDQYLNFFICGFVGDGVAGYTFFPGSNGTVMENGVWVLHNYVGRIGTSDESSSRVLTHEVGHWLDLPHTWGYTNEPGLPDNCMTDDDIDDTPNTIGSTWCNLNENTCGEIANVENYMDYAYCSKMFTLGQKDRMRATLNSSIDNRNNLWSSSNLINTGTFEDPFLCKAEFKSDLDKICSGDSVKFTDLSYNKAISWNWTFEGGNPSTTNEQNPIVTYSQSGDYDVKLVVSDGLNIDSVIKINKIHVNNPSLNLPFSEDFDSFTSINSQNKWTINNFQLNNSFEINNQYSYSSSNSVYLSNYYEFGNNVDELISPNINLSEVDSLVTLSFFFAYKKRPEINNEKLQIYVSTDCGKTWNLRKTISGTLLFSDQDENSYYPLDKNDWKLVHITGINEADWSSNFIFKFKFSGQGGNNIFIDNVNIYEGPPNETLSMNESLFVDDNFIKIFPNPTNKILNLYFSNNFVNSDIYISNLAGEKIYFNYIENSDKMTIDVNSFASGLYFITIEGTNGKKTNKFNIN